LGWEGTDEGVDIDVGGDVDVGGDISDGGGDGLSNRCFNALSNSPHDWKRVIMLLSVALFKMFKMLSDSAGL